jgi:hypothetical protein
MKASISAHFLRVSKCRIKQAVCPIASLHHRHIAFNDEGGQAGFQFVCLSFSFLIFILKELL